MSKKFIPFSEGCERLPYSEVHIRRLIRDGKLKYRPVKLHPKAHRLFWIDEQLDEIVNDLAASGRAA